MKRGTGKISGMWKIALLVFVIFLCGIAAAGWILFKYYYGLMNIRSDEFIPEQQTITLSETAGLYEYETGETFTAPEETPAAQETAPDEIVPEPADNSPAPETPPSPETEAMIPETVPETLPSPETEAAVPVTVTENREEPEPVYD